MTSFQFVFRSLFRLIYMVWYVGCWQTKEEKVSNSIRMRPVLGIDQWFAHHKIVYTKAIYKIETVFCFAYPFHRSLRKINHRCQTFTL